MSVEIASNNRTKALLQKIGAAIVTGHYQPEDGFPTEAELCDQYGVSRSIMREVIKMLASKGMLDSRARKGTWILPPQQWNVLDADVLRWMLSADASLELLGEFVEIRREIEPAAAALAAERAAPQQLAKLQAAVDVMAQTDLDANQALEADLDFHVAILEASGNRFIQQMRHLVEAALRISIQLTNQQKGVAQANVAEQDAIAQAIINGDVEAARNRSQLLIDEAYELIEKSRRASKRKRRAS